MMILPALFLLSISQRILLVDVSIPEDGSSSMIIFELPIIAIATESFLF